VKIDNIYAREILDSRSNPTVEVDVITVNGIMARAAVPSGASTGSREAIELRDSDKGRYSGKGVQKAVKNVNDIIAKAIVGKDPRKQKEIDGIMIELDGTHNKAKLGANAILGVSLAVARLASILTNIPLYKYLADLAGTSSNTLPVPCMNILNGGVHARWQGADFQEFMIAPVGAKTFSEAVRWGSEVYQALRAVLKDKGLSVGVGDEGGFAPTVSSNREPLDFIIKGIEKAGYKPGSDIAICLDPASTEFFEDGKYNLRTEKKLLTSAEMAKYYEDLVSNYPIVSIEDGLAEDDWSGWAILNKALGKKIELVGDDLFVTNVKYIKEGIEKDVANSALIKLNQVGSLSETIEAVKLCQKNSWGVFVSHRSGETVDSFIADMAVGLNAKHLKTGAPARSERTEKYNQIMRIEEQLGKDAIYIGKKAFVNG
jgi:enolase